MEKKFSNQMDRFNNSNLEKMEHIVLQQKCQLFNSKTHWWVYLDRETDKVYDQYGYYIGNADFLRSEGLIS